MDLGVDVTQPAAPLGHERLRGNLGVVQIVLMVVATAAPLSVMVANTPLIVAMGNGAAAPFDMLAATVIMFLFATGFVAMSKHISNAGAFYAYVQKGLGRTVGLGTATLAIASYSAILLALEAYIGAAIHDALVTFIGVAPPWWSLSLLVVAAIAVLGYRDIELSSTFLTLALFLETSIVIVADVVIAWRDPGALLSPTPWQTQTLMSGSPGLGIMFAIYCFVGFESTVVFREEARDPDRTIPRATFLGLLAIGGFYLVSVWCEVAGFGAGNILAEAKNHPVDLYQTLVQRYLGGASKDIVQLLLITSLFACALSLHNIIVRYKCILGRYGVLPGRLAQVHPRHHSPHVASLAQTAVSLVFIGIFGAFGLDPVTQVYAWTVTGGTLGYMVILSLTCVSVFAFFALGGRPGGFLQTRVAPIGGLFGILGCLWIALTSLPALVGGANADRAAVYIILAVAASYLVGTSSAALLKRRNLVAYERLKDLA